AAGFRGRTVELALAGALFHDVGRFEQYAVFKTYSDRKSLDHGDLGAEVLARPENADLTEGLDVAFRADLRKVVGLHNKRLVPDGLEPDTDAALRVVRDADKLDIVAVMIEHLRPGAPYNPVVCLHLDPDPTSYTPAVLAQVLEGRDVRYQDMRWTNDFRLLLCSWAGALTFPASRKRYAERKFSESLLVGLPARKEFQALREWIARTLCQNSVESGGHHVRHS
ncbi:MAG: HD domain-containing protein, partial [Deltaproteobacteria bacterium]|nr:HD domain-containing protein [Deltaproteobacteria bacterium]